MDQIIKLHNQLAQDANFTGRSAMQNEEGTNSGVLVYTGNVRGFLSSFQH